MENELYHYGVLGMKWGVRRNPAKAYERASQKMTKLNKKADRAKLKYGKKARFHLTDFGIAAENKARKKSARATAKAIKWEKSMEKEFSAINLASLETKYVSKGESYMNKISTTSNPKRQNEYSSKASKNYAKSEAVKNLRERLYDDQTKR